MRWIQCLEPETISVLHHAHCSPREGIDSNKRRGIQCTTSFIGNGRFSTDFLFNCLDCSSQQPDHYTESKRDLKTSTLPIFSFFRMFALDIGVPGSSPIQCFSLHFLLFFKKSSYNTFLLKSSIKCLRTHFVYVCYQNLLTYSPASKINVVTIVSMEHLSTSEKFRANRGSFDMTWLSLSCFSYCIWQVKAHQPAALFVISHFHNCILELPVFCPHVLTWPLQVLDCWLHKVSVSSVYSFR